MPRTSAHNTNPANKKKRQPRPKKKVVAFLVSDVDDSCGFLVNTEAEIPEALKKVRAKASSWMRNEAIQDYHFNVRCVAADGTVKCATLTVEATDIKVKVTAPTGMTLS